MPSMSIRLRYVLGKVIQSRIPFRKVVFIMNPLIARGCLFFMQ